MGLLGIRTLVMGGVLSICGVCAADGTLLDDDAWKFRSSASSELVVGGGLVFGFPAALPTGFAKGAGAGITFGRRLAWGVRAYYMKASEDTSAYAITQREFHLRGTASLQHDVGRARLALRLGLGGVVVREHRVRNQVLRAALAEQDPETISYALLPDATLDGVVSLHVRGSWMMHLSGGPSVTLVDGSPHAGWTVEVGVSWQR
ncbi:MAG TPA: hypothetical protein VFQ53_31595 [Kofleriaceae bacterium]|nr:hypothetical protein [Kofleriaceae bacterium]